MRINQLVLTNYRNFSLVNINFEKGINIIHGANGAGKTNLIEAIYYLSLTRSFKKVVDNSLIKIGATSSTILAKFNKANEEHSLSISLTNENKLISLDGDKLTKLSSLIGIIYSIVFEPNTVNLLKSEPANRRTLLDEILSSLSDDYLYSLTRYKKLLKERNTVLANSYDKEFTDVITNELIVTSYPIYVARIKLIKDIQEDANNYYRFISGQDEIMKIKFISKVKAPLNQEEYMQLYKYSFQKIRDEEVNKRMTLLGIHRDDFGIEIDGKNIGVFGSQGENRTATLALKLAMAKYIEREKKEQPILILDDVFSDLDINRQEKLVECLKPFEQVFITTAVNKALSANCVEFEVTENNIIRRKQ